MDIYLNQSQRGLSLVEMMIALTLSVFLLVGVVQIFSSNKQAFTMQSGMARVQESGRVAQEFLGREIRGAGFMGCATGGFGDNFFNNVDPAKYANAEVKNLLALLNGNNSIIGFDDSSDDVAVYSGGVSPVTVSGAALLAGFGVVTGTSEGQRINGTDAVMFLGASPCDGGKVVSHSQAASEIVMEDALSCGLVEDDIVIISNCNTADAFGISKLTNATQDTIEHTTDNNGTNNLNNFYDNTSFVYRLNSSIYYLGNGAGGEPALYRKSLASAAKTVPFSTVEMAEGIEDFQIVYGENTNTDLAVNRYVSSSDVADFNNVLSVKTKLLGRSEGGAIGSTQTYTFNGVESTSTDNKYRTPYESTITIRNRVR